MTVTLDDAERRILRVIQDDAGLPTAAIAERVGLSPSPCWRRIDRLEREGVIRRRVALLDRRKVGLNAHVFAQVKLNAMAAPISTSSPTPSAPFPRFWNAMC